MYFLKYFLHGTTLSECPCLMSFLCSQQCWCQRLCQLSRQNLTTARFASALVFHMARATVNALTRKAAHMMQGGREGGELETRVDVVVSRDGIRHTVLYIARDAACGMRALRH